jgi:DNA polymerase-3 subunit delta
MEFAEFKKQVQAGQMEPAYVLTGFQPAEVRRALEMMEAVPPKPSLMIIRESYPAVDGLGPALISARSHPMWGEHKLIVLEEAEKLSEKSQKAMRNALQSYLDGPCEWATLVLIFNPPPGRRGARQALPEKAAPVAAPQLTGQALSGWVRRKLQESGLEMSGPALQHLLEVCKGDLGALEQELNKVLVAFPPGTVIGREQLEFLVETLAEESIFDFLGKVADGKVAQSLEKMEHMFQLSKRPREQVIQIWYRLHQQARDLLAVQLMQEQKGGADLASALGVNPRAVPVLRRQLGKFSKPLLRQMLESMEEVDRQMKSSYTSQPRLLLERYIISLGQALSRRRSASA